MNKTEIDLEEVHLRLAQDEDVPYLFKRTLRDLKNAVYFHHCPPHLYYHYMHRALEHTFTRCPIIVAYRGPKAIAGHRIQYGKGKILGFLIADPTDLGLVIHYANVRRSYDDDGRCVEDYRRNGILKKMVEHAQKTYELNDRIIYTMRTAVFKYEREFRAKIDANKKIEHNPFLFFTLLPDAWEVGVRTPKNAKVYALANKAL